MPFPSQPAPVNQPMEFGAGWYLRGDIGYSNMAVPVVIADFATNLGRTGNVSAESGIGYQYNNWLRTDVTLDRSVIHNGGQQASIYCPYGNGDVTVSGAGSSGSFTGNLYDPNETCTPLLDSHIPAPRRSPTPMLTSATGGGSPPMSAPASALPS